MTLAEKLRTLRKERGFTQAVLADLMTEKLGQECYRTTITKWERGNHEPNAYTLKALAEVFDVSVDFLIDTEYNNDADNLMAQLQNRPLLKKLVAQLLTEDDAKIRALCVLSGINLDK